MFSKFFSWVKSLFTTNSLYLPFNELDLYTEKDRVIFSFFDGEKIRKVDPMPLYRKYMEIANEVSADFQAFSSPIPNKFAATSYQNCISKISAMFELKPFDQGGLLETEVINTYMDYLAFCEDIKKKLNPPQTPPEGASPVPSPSGPPDTGGFPPISSTSATGSVESDKPTDKPTL